MSCIRGNCSLTLVFQRRLLRLLFLAASISGNATLAETPVVNPGTTETLPGSAKPSVGNLKGVPISIPAGYIFFPVQYEGEDPWSGKKHQNPNTYDTPVQTISLRVHLPDYAPVNKENEASWRVFFQGPRGAKGREWITAQVEARKIDIPSTEWTKKFLERTRARQNRNPIGWHYEKQTEKRYGLAVEALVGGRDRNTNADWIAMKDLLYPADTWQTVIECQAGQKSQHVCKQFFVIPEMNAMVEIDYSDERLKDWRSMQDHMTALINKFAVKGHPKITSYQ